MGAPCRRARACSTWSSTARRSSLEEAERDAGLFPTLLAARDRLPALFHPVHLNLAGPELEPAERLSALAAHLQARGLALGGQRRRLVARARDGAPGLPVPAAPAQRGRARGRRRARAPCGHGAPGPAGAREPGGRPARRAAPRARLHGRAPRAHRLSAGARRGAPGRRAAGVRPRRSRPRWTASPSRRSSRSTWPGRSSPAPRMAVASTWTTMGSRSGARCSGSSPRCCPRCRSLRALVFEGDGHPPGAARRTLATLRTLLEPVAAARGARGASARTALPRGFRRAPPPRRGAPSTSSTAGSRPPRIPRARGRSWGSGCRSPPRRSMRAGHCPVRCSRRRGRRWSASWPRTPSGPPSPRGSTWTPHGRPGRAARCGRSPAPELAMGLAFDTWAQGLARAPGGGVGSSRRTSARRCSRCGRSAGTSRRGRSERARHPRAHWRAWRRSFDAHPHAPGGCTRGGTTAGWRWESVGWTRP